MDRALILTTSSLFDRPAEQRPSSPLTMVGGLSLFHRTVLTLQRAGISHMMVLGGDELETLRRQIHGDVRVSAEVRWLPVREFPPSDPRTWETLAGMVGGSYLITGTGAVFPVSLVARLRDESRVKVPILVVRNEAILNEDAVGITRGGLGSSGDDQGVLRGQTSVTTLRDPAKLGCATMPGARVSVASSTVALDLAVVPDGFTAPGWASLEDSPYPLHAALERALRQGQVKLMPLGNEWYQEVYAEATGTLESETSVTQAEWTLLTSLKGGLEGFVDHHFNRKCSKWLTRAFLQTPLTPNAITILATLVGLLAAGAFAVGGYVAGIVGAVLFQFSAILDCCDGEVARLKFLESAFGEQLDVVLDNVVHVALFAGMAWAAYQSTWGLWALLLGGLAIFGNIAAFAVVQRAQRVVTLLDPIRRAVVDKMLHRLASRDFSIVVLAMALIGHLDWFLALAAVGSNVFWPVLAWQVRAPRTAPQRSS